MVGGAIADGRTALWDEQSVEDRVVRSWHVDGYDRVRLNVIEQRCPDNGIIQIGSVLDLVICPWQTVQRQVALQAGANSRCQ